jgi:hypothetical protein
MRFLAAPKSQIAQPQSVNLYAKTLVKSVSQTRATISVLSNALISRTILLDRVIVCQSNLLAILNFQKVSYPTLAGSNLLASFAARRT